MLYGRRRPYTVHKIRETTAVKETLYLKKNILTVILITTMVSLLFFGPTYHFISENFKIFTSLAYENQPSLVPHLERELKWINLFFSSAIMGFVTFSAFFFYKSFRNTLMPVEKVARHIELLKNGKYHTEEIPTIIDGFALLSQNYAEFHRSLKNRTTEELALLELIEIDDRNHNSVMALKKLITDKKEQLGLIETNANVVNLNVYDQQRRAS